MSAWDGFNGATMSIIMQLGVHHLMRPLSLFMHAAENVRVDEPYLKSKKVEKVRPMQSAMSPEMA